MQLKFRAKIFSCFFFCLSLVRVDDLIFFPFMFICMNQWVCSQQVRKSERPSVRERERKKMFTSNGSAYNLSRRYCKSIHVANILLVIIVTINCIGSGRSNETSTNEPLLGTEHIEKLCVEKCPNQVSCCYLWMIFVVVAFLREAIYIFAFFLVLWGLIEKWPLPVYWLNQCGNDHLTTRKKREENIIDTQFPPFFPLSFSYEWWTNMKYVMNSRSGFFFSIHVAGTSYHIFDSIIVVIILAFWKPIDSIRSHREKKSWNIFFVQLAHTQFGLVWILQFICIQLLPGYQTFRLNWKFSERNLVRTANNETN